MRRMPVHALGNGAMDRAWPTLDEATAASLPGFAQIEAQQAADIYKQAYLDGFDAGHTDGEQAARMALLEAEKEARTMTQTACETMRDWRLRVVSLAESFAQAEARLHLEMEALAVEVAFAATCRVVGELHAKHELVTAFCREAVKELQLTPTQLRVSPPDHQQLVEKNLQMPCISDPALGAGGCLIETELGEVETGVETRMQAVLRALLDSMRRDGMGP